MRHLLAGTCLATALLAQASDPVIRISTSLVQIDAIVTDKDGHLVTDLQAGDFEIFQDAKRRETTAFSFVRVAEPNPRQSRRSAKSLETQAPPPARGGIVRGQVHRTVAIVVDDLSVDLVTMSSVRDAVKRFVNTQLRDGDLAALVTTSGGMGIYSQFTADPLLLATAAEMLGRAPRLGLAGSLDAAYVLSDEVRCCKQERRVFQSATTACETCQDANQWC
jgi:VWFA-related protein